ncbi:hypothetical protein [Myxosarcina sp. GI1(2024)]
MNTTIVGKHSPNTQTINLAGAEIGKAINGGTPSESLLKFSGETVPTVPMPDKTSESTLESTLVEAIDGGSPTPELEQIIQEANSLYLETAIESHHLEEAADIERVSHSSKQNSITKTVESIDAGQCPHFNR